MPIDSCHLLTTYLGVPESPRWLISKDRNDEALKTLAKWHANGNENNLTVQFEYREIKETLHIEKEVSRSSSYADFFKTRGNRWRLAIIISIGIISQYSGNAVVSNYANLIYQNAGITAQTQKLGVSTAPSPKVSLARLAHCSSFHSEAPFSACLSLLALPS